MRPYVDLHAEQPAVRGRDSDRAAAVAAGARREQPRGHGRGRGSARRTAGGAAEVPRVSGDSVQRRVREAHRAVLRRGGEPGEHRAGRPQASDLGVVVLGDLVGVDDRRVSGRPARDVRELLHADRQPGQRTRVDAGGDARVDRVGGRRTLRPRRGSTPSSARGRGPRCARGSPSSRSRARTWPASHRVGQLPRLERLRTSDVAVSSSLPRRTSGAACVQLGERVLDARRRARRGRGTVSRSASDAEVQRHRSTRGSRCRRPRFRDSGTIGYASSIRAPMQ